jgi:hypothetical protein
MRSKEEILLPGLPVFFVQQKEPEGTHWKLIINGRAFQPQGLKPTAQWNRGQWGHWGSRVFLEVGKRQG